MGTMVTKQISNQFKEFYFGVNWTWVNLKDSLDDITWEEANTKIYSLNSIVSLVFHINYYLTVVIRVLEGEQLKGSDKLSFNQPPITSEEDWNLFLQSIWENGERFITVLENMEERKLWENIGDEKYGKVYRNIHGIIEHGHYHLGQIVLIKKILREMNKN